MEVGGLYMHGRDMALVGCVLLLPSCTHKSRLIKKDVLVTPSKQSDISFCLDNDPSNITVLIHGTKLVVRSSYYTQFNGKPALKHAREFSSDPKMHAIFTELSTLAPDMFAYDQLYFFGWSGKLSVKERDDATEILYDELVDLVESYYACHNVKPKVRLICHSHGGNIALTLARIHAKKQQDLLIDSLIALACPVQLSTKDFVECPLFERVYAFYSTFDFVQVIAPEIAHYVHNEKGELVAKKRCWFPFSARCFDKRAHVKQARVKMNNHAVLHSYFSTVDFLCTLPHLIQAVDDAYAHHEHAIVQDQKEVLCAIRQLVRNKYA